jgi:UDP-N-acetylmuramoyl-tripeptide--D-alanyl-D-alanine ligase
MAPLAEALDGDPEIIRASNVDEATDALMRIVRPGDAVLVKASNSVGLAKLVERVAGGLACST